jgi:carbamoyltransferase
MDAVERIFVCPNMGDGGLGLGCILEGVDVAPRRLDHVFWGEDYSAAQMAEAVAAKSLPYEQVDDAAGAIAGLLAQGRIVARFTGRMEWGPRALGNRSILADASDRSVVSRLNGALRRNDFMPFAPAMLHEAADTYLESWQSGLDAARFMTTCFRCTEAMKARFPGVVHVDGTARAQLVAEGENPAFHALLRACEKKLGAGVVLNTSFNIHEEPIVRTPEEAVRAFEASGIDHLAIGDFIVNRRDYAS